jgi:hypothetical protein
MINLFVHRERLAGPIDANGWEETNRELTYEYRLTRWSALGVGFAVAIGNAVGYAWSPRNLLSKVMAVAAPCLATAYGLKKRWVREVEGSRTSAWLQVFEDFCRDPTAPTLHQPYEQRVGDSDEVQKLGGLLNERYKTWTTRPQDIAPEEKVLVWKRKDFSLLYSVGIQKMLILGEVLHDPRPQIGAANYLVCQAAREQILSSGVPLSYDEAQERLGTVPVSSEEQRTWVALGTYASWADLIRGLKVG